ncbi:chemotaxis protein CheA [Derxia gummosa]|uniref:Chemotaxis protein CheA n=1 Tax=Derxia gummosa DSM 723 TaxID=1121388 RepID=A0A8B6X9G7_9BURK|nr:chemotaxis protein CheA [Derxia gummosa]
MNLDEALSLFVSESRELLEQMEAGLLELEQRPGDPEAINAIFRAAHTIKGSAGIFGFDAIVGFTHVAESVLDQVREEVIGIDPPLASLLLRSGDYLLEWMDGVAAGAGDERDASMLERGEELVTALGRYLEPGVGSAPVAAPPAEAAAPARIAADASGTEHWHLSLRFGRELFRDGFDPLSFVRYLGSMGEIAHLETCAASLPRLSEYEPDDCHLGFEIAFRGDGGRERIASAFDFVAEESDIRLLEPHAPLSDYRALAEARAAAGEPIAELLRRCGSLDEAELAALAAPADAEPACDADDDAAPAIAPHATPATAPAARAGGAAPAHPATTAPRTAAEAGDARRADAAPAARGGDVNMVRVDANKLDHLIDLVGELIVAGEGAAQIARRNRNKELMQATAQVGRLMEEVRDCALNLRMVQIGGTFNRFQRVVRDVSQELGKDIALRITGGETELDKTVVEKLADPLTHLVRNSIDHGIESAAERERAGKPAQGTVSLHAYHTAGWVVVEVGDDGGGLRRDRILAKAVERGLVAPDATLSDRDVWQLIFEPGFSTAAQISNLSGRGVGMDVVKRNITALRGSIDIRSQEGVGTTISIRLPLTLAIIDGFMMAVGGAAYVVPLDTVVECIALNGPAINGQGWLDLRGEVLPLVRLRELHELGGEPGRRQNVVVVDGGGMRVGIVVDQLMGELQTVIKPLGKVFRHVRGVGGFTILASGAVALLLDVPTLIQETASRAQRGCDAGVSTPSEALAMR